MDDLEDVTPKAIRILIAEHDLKLQQVAEVAGVGYKGLSDIIHGWRVRRGWGCAPGSHGQWNASRPTRLPAVPKAALLSESPVNSGEATK